MSASAVGRSGWSGVTYGSSRPDAMRTDRGSPVRSDPRVRMEPATTLRAWATGGRLGRAKGHYRWDLPGRPTGETSGWDEQRVEAHEAVPLRPQRRDDVRQGL